MASPEAAYEADSDCDQATGHEALSMGRDFVTETVFLTPFQTPSW